MNPYEFSIGVRTQYVEDQSNPDDDRYVFAYTITIRNTGKIAAQLISRHWLVADANDTVQEVNGLGVVGHQPLLKPGENFEYTSGTALATPTGSMRGEYFFVAEDGARFEVPIPEFSLAAPRTLH
jgi:ApaG protein